MAKTEKTACIPPIIEEESDENLLPVFYQKELERKDFLKKEKSYNEECTGQLNELPLPYNSWKARNRMLPRSVENGTTADMVSVLGQSLENCNSVVSGRIQDSLRVSNTPREMHNLDNGVRQVPMSKEAEQVFMNHNDIGNHRYVHAPQDVINSPQMFDPNFMQTPSRIYAGSIGGYPGFPHHGNMNQFSHDGNFHFPLQSPISHPYEQIKISPSSMKCHSVSKSTFNSETSTPRFPPEGNRFNSETPTPRFPPESNRFNKASPSQQGYCQSSYRDMMSQERNRFPNSNGPYFEHNASLTPLSSNSCHCHHGLDIKASKKQSKSEKIKNRQINDLYRIVWLQNQQLIQLQNEVKKLIESNVKNEERSLKASELEQSSKKQSKSTMEKRMFNLQVIEENKNLMEKVSVGIMTSFIDTSSMKKKGNSRNAKKEVETNVSDSSTESESSSSTCSSSEKDDTSVQAQKKKGKKKVKNGKYIEDSILNGVQIPTFAENIPSPAGSLHIDMQDYGTSTSSSSDVSDSGEEPSPVSWTFYDKVVGKVNNMLNKSGSESEDSDNEIRNNTLEQLKKLGVSVEESPVSKRVTFNEAAFVPQQQKLFLGESDTSLKMNALALKYLQEDKISDESSSKYVDKCAVGPPNNTNLSVATLRYLEKYHLLPRVSSGSPEVKIEKTKKKKGNKKSEKKKQKSISRTNQHSGKILDITAIKQQPKLLPKNHGNR